MSADEPAAPDPEAVAVFWADARVRAGLNPARAETGPSISETLPPPAWSFGDTRESADELATLVLAGLKTATCSSARDYEAEGAPLPTPGELSIICDGAGLPVALITTTSVRTVPFEEVDAEHAVDEGEGDGSLATWRQEHQRFFTGADGEFDPRMPVVLERFEVLVPHGPQSPTGRLAGR